MTSVQVVSPCRHQTACTAQPRTRTSKLVVLIISELTDMFMLPLLCDAYAFPGGEVLVSSTITHRNA